MHPPPFSLTHRLSDWPACYLELQCCQGATIVPVSLLADRHGDRTFEDILTRLKCQKCGSKPAPVYLCAGQHRGLGPGPPPDWSVQLVPPPVP